VLRRVDILMPIAGHLGIRPRDPLVRCRKVGIGKLGREVRGSGLVLFVVRPVELRRGSKKGESGGQGMSERFQASRSRDDRDLDHDHDSQARPARYLQVRTSCPLVRRVLLVRKPTDLRLGQGDKFGSPVDMNPVKRRRPITNSISRPYTVNRLRTISSSPIQLGREKEYRYRPYRCRYQ
jgi:hypothetical protein